VVSEERTPTLSVVKGRAWSTLAAAPVLSCAGSPCRSLHVLFLRAQCKSQINVRLYELLQHVSAQGTCIVLLFCADDIPVSVAASPSMDSVRFYVSFANREQPALAASPLYVIAKLSGIPINTFM
jgi:hypothetical protein